MGRIRRALSRARHRIARKVGAEPESRGPVPYDAEVAELWTGLRDEYKNAYRTMASAAIASWEVASTDLHRLLRERRGQEVASRWTERFSDSIVPALGSIQDIERAGNTLWKQTVEAAEQSGTIDSALALLAAQARTLGSDFAEAWPKTVDYLDPVFEDLQTDPAVKQELYAVGPQVQEALDASAEELATALAGVAVATDVQQSFLDAIESYRHAGARHFELLLDEVRQIMTRVAQAS